jgi:hypothetical protein
MKFKMYNITTFCLLILVVTSFFSNFLLTANAALPDIYTINPTPVSTTDKRVFEIYLPYGNPYLNKEIKNSSLSVNFRGEGLEIAGEEVYDFYFDDKDLASNLNFPRNKILSCEAIPKYKDLEIQKGSPLKPKVIAKTLFTKTGIPEYTGMSAPESKTVGVLPANGHGCIGLNVKINDKVKNGDIFEITLNPNIKQSDDYQENERPGIVTFSFIFSDGVEKCNVQESEKFIRGGCVKPCATNELNNFETGKCEVKVKICNSFEDNVNGNCYKKCKEEEGKTIVRDGLGNCKKDEKNNINIVDIYNRNNGILYTGVVLASCAILGFAYLITSRIKKAKASK